MHLAANGASEPVFRRKRRIYRAEMRPSRRQVCRATLNLGDTCRITPFGSIGHGCFGIFEDRNDFDLRANVQFLGGVIALLLHKGQAQPGVVVDHRCRGNDDRIATLDFKRGGLVRDTGYLRRCLRLFSDGVGIRRAGFSVFADAGRIGPG